MKNRMMQIAVVVGVTAAALSVQAGKLPEFMNAQQLTAWRAQHAAPAVAAAQAPDEQAAFFTGKPYDAASGTYLFKYRAYNPTLARWTSADPSGFPDGANGFSYCDNNAVGCFDKYGLFVQVTYHRVTASTSYHTALKIVPNNPNDFVNDDRFKKDSNGQLCLIISAARKDGKLTKEEFRPTDLDNTAGDFVMPNNGNIKSDTERIRDIIKAYDEYDNKTEYTLYPSTDSSGYNSNSFTAGVLTAAGVHAKPPDANHTPGWAKPLPLKKTYE